MCSYNAVNGVPSCASRGLINDLARGAWGFDGYVTSDCGAIDDIKHAHAYASTDAAAARDVLVGSGWGRERHGGHVRFSEQKIMRRHFGVRELCVTFMMLMSVRLREQSV